MCDKRNALVDRACRWPGDTNKHRYVTAALSVSSSPTSSGIRCPYHTHQPRRMVLEPPSDDTLRVKPEVLLDPCEKVERRLIFG